MKTDKRLFLVAFGALLCGTACARQETDVTLHAGDTAVVASVSKNIKRKVAIGRFSNETQYGKGLFYDKENGPMGKQA